MSTSHTVSLTTVGNGAVATPTLANSSTSDDLTASFSPVTNDAPTTTTKASYDVRRAMTTTQAQSSYVSTDHTPQYKTIYVTKTAEPTNMAHTVGKSGLAVGALAGISIGSFAILLAIGFIAFYVLRRRKGQSAESDVQCVSVSREDSIAEKDNSGTAELGGHGRVLYEASSGVVHEMDGASSAKPARKNKFRLELDSRSISFKSEGSPGTPTMIDSRHIMSRGRPVKRDNG